MTSRGWSRIRLGCAAASAAVFALAVIVIGSLTPWTGRGVQIGGDAGLDHRSMTNTLSGAALSLHH